MPGFGEIRIAYEEKLRQAMEALVVELQPGRSERDQIALLNRLFIAILDTYASHNLDFGPDLDVHTSVMYAAEGQREPQVLNVTLLGLVDYNSLTTAQARMLTGLLSAKRTLLITGPGQSGKSTLLNALLLLLPRDSQVVAVEEHPELPCLRDRPFTLTLQTKPGTPGAAEAFRRAAVSRPACLVAGKLALADAVPFFQALHPAFGLATVDSPDPEMSLAEWQANSPEIDALLLKTRPVFLHIVRDSAGRPRLNKTFETRPLPDGSLRLVEVKPG